MTTRKVPPDVADELQRISDEIACLSSLLVSADVFGEFPTTGREGLGWIMNRWRDDLSRLAETNP